MSTPMNLNDLELRMKSTFAPPKALPELEILFSLIEGDVAAFRSDLERGHLHCPSNFSNQHKKRTL